MCSLLSFEASPFIFYIEHPLAAFQVLIFTPIVSLILTSSSLFHRFNILMPSNICYFFITAIFDGP